MVSPARAPSCVIRSLIIQRRGHGMSPIGRRGERDEITSLFLCVKGKYYSFFSFLKCDLLLYEVLY